jgi:hypothetical protein
MDGGRLIGWEIQVFHNIRYKFVLELVLFTFRLIDYSLSWWEIENLS